MLSRVACPTSLRCRVRVVPDCSFRAWVKIGPDDPVCG
jgi:hypothetical protein